MWVRPSIGYLHKAEELVEWKVEYMDLVPDKVSLGMLVPAMACSSADMAAQQMQLVMDIVIGLLMYSIEMHIAARK